MIDVTFNDITKDSVSILTLHASTVYLTWNFPTWGKVPRQVTKRKVSRETERKHRYPRRVNGRESNALCEWSDAHV
jgi:hypothetical protein